MTVRLTIDERPVEAEYGTSILQAARQNGIYIPTLCDLPSLPPHGSCRLCIVEIEGSPRMPTACTTPVQEGMVVSTSTPRLAATRSDLLRLLLSEHPLSCLVCPERENCEECMVTLRKAGATTGCASCPKNGQCELQRLVDAIGLGDSLHPTRYRSVPVERADPFFDRDYNLCVLCGRCIRICEDIHFSGTLTYTNRGSKTLVGTAYGRSHLEAGCSFCGSCVEVCPTGALSEKTRKWDGVPDRETQSTCVFCGLGCSMRLIAKNNIVIGSLPDEGHLCVKGRFGVTEQVSHPYRLTAPSVAVGERQMATGWNEAIAAAVEQMAGCPPGGFAMHVSADLPSEDLYVAQKFARVAMGTHQVMTVAMDVYGRGLNALIRLLKNAAPLDALKESDAILCLGLDTRFAQSIVETQLLRARQRGAKLYTIHPGLHSLSLHADRWLQPAPNHLSKLLSLLVRLVGGEGEPDADEEVSNLADNLGQARRLAVLVSPEILHHPDNDMLLEAVEKLAEVTGASIVPLVAEGNLTGSFLVGAYPELLPGGFASSDAEQRGRIGQLWGRPLPEPAAAGQPALLYLIGVQPPSTGQVSVVYQNIDHPLAGQHVDLVLPAAAFSEVDGSVADFHGLVLPLHRAVRPPGEALPSWQILCRIAQAMNVPGFNYSNVEDIQAEMAELIEGYGVGGCLSMDALSPVFSTEEPQTDAPKMTSAKRPFVLDAQIVDDSHMGFPMARRVEGLRALVPMNAIVINPDDAAQEGISQGDEVLVSASHFEHVLPAYLDRRQQPGVLRVVFAASDTVSPLIAPAEIRKAHVQTD